MITQVVNAYFSSATAPYGTHQYWRIFVTANSGDATSTKIDEIEFRGSVSGSDLTGSGTAISGGSGSDSSGAEAAKAFDNTAGTSWTRTSPVTCWVGYNFGSAVAVAEVALTGSNVASQFTLGPQTFSLDYSDDGSSWTTAASFTAYGWLQSQQRVYPEAVPAAGAHRFWRIFCADNNGGSSFITLDDIEFRSTVSGADQTTAQSANNGSSTGRIVRSSEAAGNEAFHAFAADTTSWAGNGTTNQYAGYIFPSPIVIAEAALKAQSSGTNISRSPNNVHLDYSDDGVTWTAGTTRAQGAWTAGQVKTVLP